VTIHHPDELRLERRHARPPDDEDGYATGSCACPEHGVRLTWLGNEFACPECLREQHEADEREAER
jgi:hypothetical protein